MSHIPTIRIARPTSSINTLLPFYITGLGLEVLSSFQNHNDFDGVIIGHPNAPWHLEFTTYHGPNATDTSDSKSEDVSTADVHETRAPSTDHLLVIYIPDRGKWESAVKRMRDAGFESVKSFNPWWDADGLTFEDAEGWRVVLQGGAWTK